MTARAARLIVGFVLVVVAIVAIDAPANAYNDANCKKHDTLNYYQIGAYATASNNAVDAWIAAPVALAFSPSSNPDIFIDLGGYGSSGYDGITYLRCGTGTQVDPSESYYNGYYTSDYGTTARKQVMVHELGHAMGLGHAGSAMCSGQPIMYKSSDRWFICGHQNPQADDNDGINHIY
ncbi:matrixin family metalloprotease [Nocardioides sp.]|uniref:matrixin family metalloprotease n=1 Tax=Nocardioides sp. TaxID=35761 RepID=UPI002EDB78AF